MEVRTDRLVVIVLLLFAATLGVFSSGTLSHTVSTAPNGAVEVEYERFVRQMGTAEVTIRVQPSAVRNGTATVTVSRTLIDCMRLDAISHEPESTLGSRNGLTYEFRADEAESPLVITITFRPTDIGVAEETVNAQDDTDGARMRARRQGW